jgi:predicted amidophosphoribosyltransferase
VTGAFEYRKPKALEDRCILLVDDVMTTGATVNVCSKELMKGGARSVYVMTVARR